MRQQRDGRALRGSDRFVVGRAAEPTPVIAEDDRAGAIAEADAQHESLALRVIGEPLERGVLGLREPARQRPSREKRLDAGVGQQRGFRLRGLDAAVTGVAAVGVRQRHTEQHDGHEADGRVLREEAQDRSGRPRLRHRCLIGSKDAVLQGRGGEIFLDVLDPLPGESLALALPPRRPNGRCGSPSRAEHDDDDEPAHAPSIDQTARILNGSPGSICGL